MLILAATPIGNVGDASQRLKDSLLAADVIAAEDTRRFSRLAKDLGLTLHARVLSYFEGNESARTEELLEYLREEQTVVLVTDAGMPSVSDPGFRLVAAAVAENFPVTVVPGPSAVLAALAVSGLGVSRFSFEGFLPRKTQERATVLAALGQEPRTMVFFEAPHRAAETLQAMTETFGPERRIALCRELTKTYEEVIRGTLAEVESWANSTEIKGEITLVVEGAQKTELTDTEISTELHTLISAGMSVKDAVEMIASSHQIRKNRVYQIAHQPSPGTP